MDTSDFWQWVTRRKVHVNLRGNFIREVRHLMTAGIYPETWSASAPPDMKAIHRRLRKQFEKELSEREAYEDIDRLFDEESPEPRGPLR